MWTNEDAQSIDATRKAVGDNGNGYLMDIRDDVSPWLLADESQSGQSFKQQRCLKSHIIAIFENFMQFQKLKIAKFKIFLHFQKSKLQILRFFLRF